MSNNQIELKLIGSKLYFFIKDIVLRKGFQIIEGSFFPTDFYFEREDLISPEKNIFIKKNEPIKECIILNVDVWILNFYIPAVQFKDWKIIDGKIIPNNSKYFLLANQY